MSTNAALARYDADADLRSRLAAMYLSNRRGLISALILLAYELGCSRPEAVEFCNTVTRRIKAAISEEKP